MLPSKCGEGCTGQRTASRYGFGLGWGQDFAAVRSRSGQIVFVSPQAPLIEFGGINTGKWQEVAHVEKPYIYSHALNNYWDTNFRAAQEGGLL